MSDTVSRTEFKLPFLIKIIFSVAASLIDTSNSEIRICANELEEGDDLDFEVRFIADPEPDEVRI